jgi:hypothetical protein
MAPKQAEASHKKKRRRRRRRRRICVKERGTVLYMLFRDILVFW